MSCHSDLEAKLVYLQSAWDDKRDDIIARGDVMTAVRCLVGTIASRQARLLGEARLFVENGMPQDLVEEAYNSAVAVVGKVAAEWGVDLDEVMEVVRGKRE
jgi:hypothetical protein